MIEKDEEEKYPDDDAVEKDRRLERRLMAQEVWAMELASSVLNPKKL